jgi:hypothetical protein
VLELRPAWPTLLRRAGEVLVTFEEYTRATSTGRAPCSPHPLYSERVRTTKGGVE